MSTEKSVLEQDYMEPDRPFSQNELEYLRNNHFRSLRIGPVRAEHKECSHFYHVKENGRKEKEIKEKNSPDIGNCSVCWKISRTPRHLKARAQKLIENFSEHFNPPKYLFYFFIDTEITYYTWLYSEFVN
jgi:hypothetical protein